MSLTLDDTDTLIANYIFDCHYKAGLACLRNMMIGFGKSNYDKFIKTCINLYYKKLFKQFEVSTIDGLIQKLLHKRTIKNYPYPKKFAEQNQQINFTGVNGRNRLFIHYYSIYFGYLPISFNPIYKEHWPKQTHKMYKYSNFWNSKRNKDGSYYRL